MPDSSFAHQVLGSPFVRLSAAEIAEDEAVTVAAAAALARGRVEPNAARAVDRFQLRVDPQRTLQYLREIRRLRGLLRDLYDQTQRALTDARKTEIEEEVRRLRVERP